MERWGKVQKVKGNDESLPFWLTKPEKVFVVLHITNIFVAFPLLFIDRLVLGLRGDPGEEGVQLPTRGLGLRPGQLLGVHVSQFMPIQKIVIFAKYI